MVDLLTESQAWLDCVMSPAVPINALQSNCLPLFHPASYFILTNY